VRVFGAQQPLAVGDDLLLEGDRVVGASRGAESEGEVRTDLERAWVLGAQQSSAVVEDVLLEGDRVAAASR
jgi:hypothetical protein